MESVLIRFHASQLAINGLISDAVFEGNFIQSTPLVVCLQTLQKRPQMKRIMMASRNWMMTFNVFASTFVGVLQKTKYQRLTYLY